MLDHFQSTLGTMGWPEKTSKGLVRISPLSSSQLYFDMSVSGLNQGKYTASVHQLGDLSNGVESAGDIITTVGQVDVSCCGKGRLETQIQGLD